MHSISVVVPVLNERENVCPLLRRIDSVAKDAPVVEVIFVDGGSTDGTIEEIERQSGRHLFSVRTVMQRARLGLVHAELLGAREARGEYVTILDGDLQHPPEYIVDMSRYLGAYDVIVASRYVKGGGARRDPVRGIISRTAVLICHTILPVSKRIRDPISGFFTARREMFAGIDFMPGSYETLLYVLAYNPLCTVKEVPYTFVERERGSSKIVGRGLSFVKNYMGQNLFLRKASRRIATAVRQPDIALK
ncbi:hypothetical protein GCM10007108_00960 [Thermogymnomonas acidicola]|uniref:Glycosyltransferase 2-like domain-containing protein n=1 Tax=Thermogymnomonas acidicola TaxID=399579 RepID=A0AA37BPQ4_9ARCH|nr:glycosyltransferase [Thermogymnomonas acidicola]GGM66576.1 hypothetical protein GCM10007108_00960 [Thermogymnomonas acidicola]